MTEMEEKYMVAFNKLYNWRKAEGRFQKVGWPDHN
jgi:hypothetical protein